MSFIHPAAIVDPGAELHESVRVGAYSVIGAGVRIGADSVIGPHVVIEGPTTIGTGNRIWQYASVGAAPQDKKYGNEPTRLEIGDRNTIREFCTINRGTAQDAGVTRIGDDNWIMAYVHIAHDCQIGSHTTFSNVATLGGHVHVSDWATIGGSTMVHQFCKIGAHVMTGTGSVVLHDIPPYITVSGNSASAHGINSEGLRRRGFDAEAINAVRHAYRILYRDGLTLDQARQALAAEVERLRTADTQASADAVALMSDFLAHVTRGIVR